MEKHPPRVEVCNIGLIDSPEKAIEAGHAFRRADVDIIFLHVTDLCVEFHRSTRGALVQAVTETSAKSCRARSA